MRLMLDLGGEGRYFEAWNVNVSRVKTMGPEAGAPIPQLIVARLEALPFADRSVDRIVIERTPITAAALREVRRIASPTAVVTLRHEPWPDEDRHGLAKRILQVRSHERFVRIEGHLVQETEFLFGAPVPRRPRAASF